MNLLKQISATRLLGMALITVGLLMGAAPAMAEMTPWMPDGGTAVAIIAILMVFGAPAVAVILIVYFVFRYRERRQRLFNERIQNFLEAGQPVPENLMQEPLGQPATPEQHLSHGLLLLGAGIGLTVFLTLVSGFAVGSLGLILIGVGVAKVIMWKLAAGRD